MDVQQVLEQARDTLTIKRVFGEPYEKNGITVIPVAAVRGGGGGGSGDNPQGQGSGAGAGFGMSARPVGAFVIKEGDLRWEPTFDLTKVALLGQVVAITFLLTIRSVVKARAKARAKMAKA